MHVSQLFPSHSLEQRNFLFQQYKNNLSNKDVRDSRMAAFTTSNEENQRRYLNALQSQILNGMKFPAPQYFASRNLNIPSTHHVKAQTKDKPFIFAPDVYEPTLFPIVSFYSNNYTTQMLRSTNPDDSIRMQMHLLKPSLIHSSGNSAFIHQKKFDPIDDTLFSPTSISKENHALFMPFEKELHLLFDTSTSYALNIDPSFHWTCVNDKSDKRIFHISEVQDTIDYHLFRKHWPIFDWEGVGRHPFQQTFSPKILL